jgi:hypothetical protein
LAYELFHDENFQISENGINIPTNGGLNQFSMNVLNAFWVNLANDNSLDTPCIDRTMKVISDVRIELSRNASEHTKNRVSVVFNMNTILEHLSSRKVSVEVWSKYFAAAFNVVMTMQDMWCETMREQYEGVISAFASETVPVAISKSLNASMRCKLQLTMALDI